MTHHPKDPDMASHFTATYEIDDDGNRPRVPMTLDELADIATRAKDSRHIPGDARVAPRTVDIGDQRDPWRLLVGFTFTWEV